MCIVAVYDASIEIIFLAYYYANTYLSQYTLNLHKLICEELQTQNMIDECHLKKEKKKKGKELALK